MATPYAGIQPYYWGLDEHTVSLHHQFSWSVESGMDIAFSFCEEVRDLLSSRVSRCQLTIPQKYVLSSYIAEFMNALSAFAYSMKASNSRHGLNRCHLF